ncbi:cell division control protein 6 homolog [Cylas formicarius]|uniref:cell division control protein 6 homolog n=1 Tax=Cylas formicarius TaxID=197179 RepID=UPI0029586CD6|nr:cell division control protein 6 homolog [Cylas formicarius]
MIGATTRSSARIATLKSSRQLVESVCKTPRTKPKKKADDAEEIDSSTPPKHAKVEPAARSDDIPTFLLENLAIRSPEGGRISKHILYSDDVEVTVTKENDENNHDRKGSEYDEARRALHSCAPSELPGRETEIEELSNFIQEHASTGTSGSMYVSGPPGTGKTATLNLILHKESIRSKVQAVYVNCTSIKSAQAVYSRIARELKINVQGKPQRDYLGLLERYLTRTHKTVLLILDEIDQLETKNQSILYTLFEWPAKQGSRLVLVGISNALDLTDRTLPRLQSRCDLQPKLVHFAPYTKDQIIKIFTSRLEAAGASKVFSAPALQMLAGKVASVSGDIRRALDVGRRVVELINQEQQKVLKSVENVTLPKTVHLKEVTKVLNNVYGTTQHLSDGADDTWPLQQKIVVCVLLLMMDQAKAKIVTLGRLHEAYRKACAKRNIHAIDQTEFVGLCSLIESRGIIKVSGKKEPRLHKVTLEWNRSEVVDALRDKQLMSAILQDRALVK